MGSFGDQLKQIESKQTGFSFAGGNLGQIITIALRYVFTFAGIALLLYFMYGGFVLFTSGGDQKKVSEGKTILTNSLIGFVVVFAAFWIVQLFGSVLGLGNNSIFSGVFK